MTGRIPLRHQSGLGELPVQPFPQVPIYRLGIRLIRGVVFYQSAGHIHTETVAALFQPELHHVPNGLPGVQGSGTSGLVLPGGGRRAETKVQSRLTFEKAQNIAAVPRHFSSYKGEPLRLFPAAVRPYVPVGICIGRFPAAFLKPGVGFAGVAGNQIQEHPDAPTVGLLKKVNEVLVGAVAGGYQLVIPYVVAGVLKGRVEAGIDPQGVTAETLDIIQFGGHAGNIANAVCIGVHKALGVDFVKYGVVKPGCCHSRSLPFVIDILGLQPKTILAYGWAKICPGGKFFEKRNRTGSVGTGPVSK